MQYVGDNTDHNTATIDGKNTHHGFGSTAKVNGKFSNFDTRPTPLPRDKKQCWSDIQSTQGIQIQNYHAPDKPTLNRVVLRPVVEEEFKASFINLLWSCSCVLLEKGTSWSGYMSVKADVQPLEKSIVTMLPVINLSATKMTALHSLLCFVVEKSKNNKLPTPSITFDQPLYVKAYEIAISNKMKIFVRLGGFHKLMSFLGSIGSLMEGSGLRRALETVYDPLTVGHMMTGKAYTRAVRGDMISASAVLSLLLEEFWDSLTTDEQAQLVKIYDSANPEEYKNDPIAVHLMQWFTIKKEVSSKSRTAALWLNYVHYIKTVQQFITAERTRNFALHISTTTQMINLFAATAHNNYAKTCRLYLQSNQ